MSISPSSRRSARVAPVAASIARSEGWSTSPSSMTDKATTVSSADSGPDSPVPVISAPTRRTGWACSWIFVPRPSSSATQIENPSAELTPTTLRRRPNATPSDQPSGMPSNSGSGATSSANGVTTQAPVSAPVSSRNQTTPVPSAVGRPSSTPTGSNVTCRREPVRRFQAWSWYVPLSVDPTTRRSGSSAAQHGSERIGARKRRSHAGMARSVIVTIGAAYRRRHASRALPMTSAALSPPNPNEVDRIRSYDPSRPSRSRFGRSAASSGSGASRLTVAGTQPSATARLAIAASSAPVAPSGWPVSAFVADTGTVVARSPEPGAMARASAMSPIGVELRVRADPVDLVGGDAGVGEGEGHGATGLATVGTRLDHVVGVRRGRVPEDLGVDVRATARRRPSSRLDHEQRPALAHDEPVPGARPSAARRGPGRR